MKKAKNTQILQSWKIETFEVDSKINTSWHKFFSEVIQFLSSDNFLRNITIYELEQIINNIKNDTSKSVCQNSKKRFVPEISVDYDAQELLTYNVIDERTLYYSFKKITN